MSIATPQASLAPSQLQIEKILVMVSYHQPSGFSPINAIDTNRISGYRELLL